MVICAVSETAEWSFMKVVILAGGFGTRISEESYIKPKPMVEIGEKPILWHIMKIYSHYGFHEFIIPLGYKGYVIKEFFADYYLHMSDMTFDFSNNNSVKIHNNIAEPWKVTLIDTGLATQTGGRIKRLAKYLGDEPFMMTYGDGLADVDITKLLAFHKQGKKLATITAIKPGGRFGVLSIDEKSGAANSFSEKSREDVNWINGGFMILEPGVLNYIDDDNTIFERDPMQKLVEHGQLMVYKHEGFWHCMDTQRDMSMLNDMWQRADAKWKVWQD